MQPYINLINFPTEKKITCNCQNEVCEFRTPNKIISARLIKQALHISKCKEQPIIANPIKINLVSCLKYIRSQGKAQAMYEIFETFI